MLNVCEYKTKMELFYGNLSCIHNDRMKNVKKTNIFVESLAFSFRI